MSPETILVLYATTGGNTRLVCQWITESLEATGCSIDLRRVEEVDGTVFDAYSTIILASPTYGHGQLEPRAIRFYRKTAKGADLSGKQVAVVGLGDPKYDDDYNIESAVILSDFATERGATILCDPLKINRTPIPQLRTLVDAWVGTFVKAIHA